MSATAQTIFDTVRTVVYDTVHTSVFDTVHTVSYDTVKVVLDSTFTIDLLNKSQEFYSNSFNWLLGIFGVFLAVIAVIFGFKLYHDLKSVNNKIKDVARKTADEAIQEFEPKFEQLRKFSTELSALVKDMQEKIILNWITQGQLAEKQEQYYHEFMCYDFALKEIVDHFDKTFAQYGKISIEKLLEKASAINASARKNKIFEEVVSKIKLFEKHLTNLSFDKDPVKAKDEEVYVSSILSLCSSVRSYFNEMIETQ